MNRIAAAVVFSAALALGAPLPAWSAGTEQTAFTAQQRAALPNFASLFKEEAPAVVNVITDSAPSAEAGGSGPAQDQQQDPFGLFRHLIPGLPEQPPQGEVHGLGSGFIISKDGFILTNAHVVEGADKVTVRMPQTKREYKGKVVGIDKRTDIALLKVDTKDALPVAELGNSASLQPGDWVAAIGSPFGFDNTITAGIVSAKGRSLPEESYVPYIQTDVAVNPGNSGGPLIDLDGKVVGINSMIYSQTGGYMGVSFAIPIEVAMRVGAELKKYGHVERGRIGVSIQPLTRDLAKSFGLSKPDGALIAQVEGGSPAARAGLQPGDVVLAWNGEPVSNADALPRLVGETKPGQHATMEIWRNGHKRQIAITTGAYPQEQAQANASGGRPPQARPTNTNRLGLVVSPLSPSESRQLDVPFGVLVEDVHNPAATPIRAGDVIVAVNNRRFDSLEQFNQLISKHQKGSSVALLVRRGQRAMYVPVPVG